ncbi:unnamed protein product [Cuscuta epithymum]|uniref:Uncharacterized protein n=1 Tax=Cuscuta epithymum TaxID=186058 RepID=A0AAV0FQ03_9ASTE|nr:unnamed protein product [Cuscuta epithymum]
MHKMTACPSPSELHTCYHDVFVFRSTVSKIYFAMFIENVTELAFQPLMMLQLKILTFPAYKAWQKLVSSPASHQDVIHSHLQMENKVPSSFLLTGVVHHTRNS